MAEGPAGDQGMRLSPKQLEGYLARVGIEGPVPLDLEGLARVQRAHLLTFTWEAIDAFMGWPGSIAPAAAYRKMVEGRRGGWCYEMNGLLGAALEALGFEVSRLCACVDRENRGDAALGNHLTLRVDLERPYLAEAGLGDALIAPIPLAHGPIAQRGFSFALEPAEEGWMRLRNHAFGIAPSVDFRPEHGDEARLLATQDWLMRDEGSPFTGALAVFRHTADGYVGLQNDRLRTVTAAGISESRVASGDQLAELFEGTFAIEVPDAAQIWNRVAARVRGG
jgi:N-hydroxyarylamine O-acetyltransferase